MKNDRDYTFYLNCPEQTPEMLLNSGTSNFVCDKALLNREVENNSGFSLDTSTWD